MRLSATAVLNTTMERQKPLETTHKKLDQTSPTRVSCPTNVICRAKVAVVFSQHASTTQHGGCFFATLPKTKIDSKTTKNTISLVFFELPETSTTDFTFGPYIAFAPQQ